MLAWRGFNQSIASVGLSDRTLRLIYLGGLLLLTSWRYASVRTADFVYEDWKGAAFIMSRPDSEFATDRPTLDRFLADPRTLFHTRVLQRLSHRTDRWVGGMDPRVPHLVNVGLHLVNGGLVAALLTGLGASPAGMALSTGIFLLHPLQTETVAYISSRTELLAGMFLLMGCLGVLSTSLYRYLLIGGGYIAAILSKEVAIMGLVLFVLVSQARPNGEYHDVTLRPVSWRLVALLCAFPWFVIVQATLQNQYLPLADQNITVLGYLLLQATMYVQYAFMTLWPVAQTVDHDPELVSSWIQVGSLAWLVIGSMFLAVGWTVRRSYHDPFGQADIWMFGLLWSLILLAPRFLVRIGETMAEHHWYLPMVGFAWILGDVIVRVWAWCGRPSATPVYLSERSL